LADALVDAFIQTEVVLLRWHLYAAREKSRLKAEAGIESKRYFYFFLKPFDSGKKRRQPPDG